MTNGEMKRALTWHDIRTIGTVVISIFIGGVLAMQFVASEARAQVDAGTSLISQRVAAIEDGIQRHNADSQRTHNELKDNMAEVQADIRALYKAVMTKEPQPRLERDGGN